ncbi:MAG: VWA domain-containing protein [Planctomycetes bacterium]|nr:VWA domain-containing protein [Planctomycetota bacterium]
MLELIADFGLLDPWLLAAALPLTIAALRRARRGTPALRFAPAALAIDGAARQAAFPASSRVRLRGLPRVLQALGLGAALVALARPVERVQQPLQIAGIDVLLCLDASSSMALDDLDRARSRLDVAKDAASRFVAARTHDRIGLVRFAKYPDVVCPPTLDHDALQQFLLGIALVDENAPEDQTGIGAAVARAAQVLRSSDARSKVVVLLTDGEENVARADTPDEIGPLRAARLCAELGVRVYTIAAGIGRLLPSRVFQPIDTTQVRELAETTGGTFYAATDARSLIEVFASIDGLEKNRYEEPRYELEDRYRPFLLAAVALLVAARALRATALRVLP